MTVNTRIIKIFLSRHCADYVPLSDGLRLQVLPSIEALPKCQKHHFAAFIRDSQMLVVWDDQPKNMIDRASHIEESLMRMIWGNGEAEVYDEKKSANVSTVDLGAGVTPGELEDAMATPKRPTKLLNPIMVGATLTLLTAALGLGWKNLAQEVAIDGNYTRLALLVVTPCQVFVSLFFMQIIVVNLAQIFGPISQLNINSKFYSGIAPRRLNRSHGVLPHVTIQMPVYKEGLVGVIQPTIISLKAAISTYELQGGTANIFVNDDGMQLVSAEEARARRDFYEEHNIGWVARPKHNPRPEDGEKIFLRRGKFKKASNMNYALMVSNKVEEKLLLVQRHAHWTQEDEYKAYDACLADVLTEEEGRAWAEGNIRVGDYILLIDSDTRVPVDCLLDAGSEMEQSPEVGILQYSSGVMQVTDSFFENGLVYGSHQFPLDLRSHHCLGLPFLPTSYTRLSVTPLLMAMCHPLLATMLFSDGLHSSRSSMKMKMDMRSSGLSRTSPRILICPFVCRWLDTLSDLVLTPAMDLRKASHSPSTMN
jgi:hypothetical protein